MDELLFDSSLDDSADVESEPLSLELSLIGDAILETIQKENYNKTLRNITYFILQIIAIN